MKFSAKLLSLSIIVIFASTIVFDFSQPLVTKQSVKPIYFVMTIAQSQSTFDLESNQLFSGAAGSTIEYNLYIENRGRSIASYTLTALSNKGYYVEVWQDTDQTGSGDVQLLPPQGSTLTISAGMVATLIVKVTIPSDATEGTIDNTLIRAVDSDSGASDSVTATTTVNSDLPYPSNWIQLGSDPTFPTPPPERIDVKAVYYTNNGTYVFFRMAEVGNPNPTAFLYCVYLDTKAGGQQTDSYNYDYILSSDGILYEWNGVNWINSGYPTYWQVDGTGMVLWSDLNNLNLDMQEVHVLSRTTTKNFTWKDEVGPYTILRNNISELPLILIPVLSFAIYFTISRRIVKKRNERGRISPALSTLLMGDETVYWEG
jgi:hypothetical protein